MFPKIYGLFFRVSLIRCLFIYFIYTVFKKDAQLASKAIYIVILWTRNILLSNTYKYMH